MTERWGIRTLMLLLVPSIQEYQLRMYKRRSQHVFAINLAIFPWRETWNWTLWAIRKLVHYTYMTMGNSANRSMKSDRALFFSILASSSLEGRRFRKVSPCKGLKLDRVLAESWRYPPWSESSDHSEQSEASWSTSCHSDEWGTDGGSDCGSLWQLIRWHRKWGCSVIVVRWLSWFLLCDGFLMSMTVKRGKNSCGLCIEKAGVFVCLICANASTKTISVFTVDCF